MKTKKTFWLISVLSGLILIITAAGCSKDDDGKGDPADADGNTYKTVTIGQQTWFAENLKTTRYNDGTAIPNVTDSTWDDLTTGAYCNYDNDENNVAVYGRLYNWYSVDTGKLCPSEWHVPSDEERAILLIYLIENGYNYDSTTIGNKMAKSMASVTGWNASEEAGDAGASPETNNRTGLSIPPAGYRRSGGFSNLGARAYLWSSSQSFDDDVRALNIYLSADGAGVGSGHALKLLGYSVRCVKNN